MGPDPFQLGPCTSFIVGVVVLGWSGNAVDLFIAVLFGIFLCEMHYLLESN